VPNTVVYTGTHDNDTTLGWWKTGLSKEERAHVETYVQPIEGDEEIVWAMMRTAARSVANLCIFPMQDILMLGSEARMNTPSERLGNWTWRYGQDELSPQVEEKLAARLAELMVMTDRDGYVAPKSAAGAAAG
jgi:4-alpha-glucanotransferase